MNTNESTATSLTFSQLEDKAVENIAALSSSLKRYGLSVQEYAGTMAGASGMACFLIAAMQNPTKPRAAIVQVTKNIMGKLDAYLGGGTIFARTMKPEDEAYLSGADLDKSSN